MISRTALEIALILLCGVPAFLFCVLYTAYANWWRSPAGRHLFFLTLGIAGLAGVSVARRLVGTDWQGFSYATLFIYLFLAWQLWQRLRLLHRANHPYPDARPPRQRREATSEDG